MSSSQHHTNNQPITATGADTESAAGVTSSHSNQGEVLESSRDRLSQRNSLTVAELSTLGATNTSTSVFQRNAARTLRTELGVDAVIIIDYTDAFGGKSVRAISGMENGVLDSEIWLPSWLSPVDINSPLKVVDVDPSEFTAISVMGSTSEYRSALAIAIPGVTGAAGMIIALSTKPVDFDDSQIDKAKMIVSMLSLSASRSNALNGAERGESQLAASRLIARSKNTETPSSTPKTLLAKIADQLKQFFEFDVIALRVQADGKFVTREALGVNQNHNFAVPNAVADPDTASSAKPIDARASEFSVALTNTIHQPDNHTRQSAEVAWKSVGIESVLAIPVICSDQAVVVLGSTRFAAYTHESVAIANRFVPALTAAFAGGSSAPVEAISRNKTVVDAPEYIESTASAT